MQNFIVLAAHNNPNDRLTCWCEVPAEDVGGVIFEQDCKIENPQRVNDPDGKVNGAQFIPRIPFEPDREYRVILKGDFIRDKTTGKAVDADHLPEWVPTRKTGDGVEGGTFESWFIFQIQG